MPVRKIRKTKYLTELSSTGSEQDNPVIAVINMSPCGENPSPGGEGSRIN